MTIGITCPCAPSGSRGVELPPRSPHAGSSHPICRVSLALARGSVRETKHVV